MADIVKLLNEISRIIDKKQVEIKNLLPYITHDIISVQPVDHDTMGKVVLVELSEEVFYLPKMYTSVFTESIIERINSQQVKISVMIFENYNVQLLEKTHVLSFYYEL